MVAEEVLATYRFDRHARVLDVGGGNGAFLRAVAAEAPRLDLMLFDLPAVAEEARARFAAAGLGARASVHGGDFTQDALPRAPTSSRWCACCTTMTTTSRLACCAGFARRCRPAARCCWPSRWPAPAAPSRWARPISASTCWRWGAGRPRTPDEIRSDARGRRIRGKSRCCQRRRRC